MLLLLLIVGIGLVCTAGLATVTIERHTGSGPTATNVTSINTRLNAEDAHSTAGTTNPIQIPASGTNYSFIGNFRLNVTVAPTTQISNVVWYQDGTSLGTGVGANVKDKGNGTYAQATGTAGVSGDAMSGGSAVGGYTSSAPMSVTGSTTTTGLFGDYVQLQVTVGTTASAGSTGQPTVTWAWDES